MIEEWAVCTAVKIASVIMIVGTAMLLIVQP